MPYFLPSLGTVHYYMPMNQNSTITQILAINLVGIGGPHEDEWLSTVLAHFALSERVTSK